LTSRYFGFLASLSRPFLKFCINNALIPLAGLLVYSILLFQFNAPWEIENGGRRFFYQWSSLVVGVVLSLLLYMVYFYMTNRDIYYYTGRRPSAPNLRVLQPFGRQLGHNLDTVQKRENPYRIRSYLNDRLKSRLVRSIAHYDRSTLEEVFRQNHWNAIFLQFTTLLALVLLGLLIDNRVFQIPAGASLLILFSLVNFLIGAVSYWFEEWRLTILLLFLLVANWITSWDFLKRSNYAYGIDYEQEKRAYTEEHVEKWLKQANYYEDSLATIRILENWRAHQPEKNPPLILLCASGGGLTAATWSTHVLQKLEQATNRQLFSRTVLMTGASGGMLGVGYLREVHRIAKKNSKEDLLDPIHIKRISSDLLNPIAFSIVSNDLFLPLTEVKIGDETYLRDRAYGFERKLNINTGGILDKALADYREDEALAEIPLLFLTPSIVNDGRRLTLSPQNVSYMMSGPASRRADSQLGADAIDLATLLGEEQRDSLRFLTALRMNATYPYVLPFVHLPTEPTVRVMDAGYRDNYGILSAARFTQIFADWIKHNTREVLLIQISVFRGEEVKQRNDNLGIVESLLDPVGLAGNVTNVQALEQDNTLGLLFDLLGPDRFHLVRFNYRPNEEDRLRTSISFHLTESERTEIIEAIEAPDHQKNIQKVVNILR
ncbi:MAG: hypothetical protein AAFU03_09980, partial [Bacteroidota bacterium]